MTLEELQETIRLKNDIDKQEADIRDLDKLIKCESGVIEGAFGKFRQFIVKIYRIVLSPVYENISIKLYSDDLKVLKAYRQEKLQESKVLFEKNLKK